MSSTKETIKSQINELSSILITAKLSYEIWWVLVGPDQPKVVDTLNNYLSFFRPTIDAHYHTLIISLYKLYDTRKGTINFNLLIRFAKANWPTSENELTYIEKTYGQALTLWKKVKIIRHEFYAHQAVYVDIADMYSRAKVKPDQFKELIDLTIEILNKIYLAFNRTTITLSMISATNDTYRLLNKLDKENNQ